MRDRMKVGRMNGFQWLPALGIMGQLPASTFAASGGAQAGMQDAGTARFLQRFSALSMHIDRVIKLGQGVAQRLSSPDERVPSLGLAFAEVLSELQLASTVRYRVVMIGRQKEINGWLWDEAYNIGREAIVNAFRHSRASEIEIEIHYLAAKLRIAVRDNGRGIDPGQLQPERNEKQGLKEMHERAQRIGARLRVWSRAEQGTEVELCVPGKVAFEPMNQREALT
jgi:glucose-6-phosphate-specific signal transduction histidine kinase